MEFHPAVFLATRKYPQIDLWVLSGRKHMFFFLYVSNDDEWLVFIGREPNPDTTSAEGEHTISWVGNDLVELDDMENQYNVLIKYLDVFKNESYKELASTIRTNLRSYKLAQLGI